MNVQTRYIGISILLELFSRGKVPFFGWLPAAFIGGLSAALLIPANAQAQGVGDPSANTSVTGTDDVQTSRQIYEAAYFDRFAPQTALDMVRQLPGFSIEDATSARGLGQAAANVTVNGQRITSKSNSIETLLGRIAARDVIRIEIVDGASLSVPGLSGQVANVVIANTEMSGQFEWRGQYNTELDYANLTRGNLSVSGSSGAFTYTVAASNNASLWGATGTSVIVDAEARLIETQTVYRRSITDRPRASVNLGWLGPSGASAELDLSYQREWGRGFEDEALLLPTGEAGLRENPDRETRSEYEIGANVRFGLGPGLLRLIGLLQSQSGEDDRTSIVTLDNIGQNSGRRFITDDTTSERILRAEYDWPMLGGDWQLAGEGAFNSLRRNSTRLTLQSDGSFTEVSFPDGSVDESRYEGSVSVSYPLASNISIQTTVAAELSRISQAGSVELTRQFLRPKGSVLLSWVPSPDFDMAINFQRLVGQLSFGDFLARLFVDTGDQNAGNAQLVPPQEWRVDVEFNKSLGEWGQASVLVFGRRIEDLVEIIPVDGGQSPGNIASASEYGVELDATLELAPIGITGARLDLGVQVIESRLDDPLTGQRRRFSRTEYREYDIEYRHDIPGTDWAYGMSLRDDVQAPSIRLTEISTEVREPRASLFVEHKDILGLNVNLEWDSIFGNQTYVRTRFDGFRSLDVIESVEEGVRLSGSSIRLRIKGNF